MNYQDLLNSLTPEVYENLKRAVELGKWPDGRVVTPEQRQHCMEAVIAYEHKHLPPEQHTGYIPPKPHTHCGGEGEVAEAEQPLKWK
ncbi:hypothetical protein EDC38_0606 [Marinimicrobium koreense]|uniref:DUF1315 family protein n=1 Tax=Marinimicrobium koreense TaxID=306545 RepID=A0A3N1NV26_9GAMM|nr:DUF1315 family protein [Marinimicrobium koreense]ROQ20013.1 hypothetical protein EDC38_0606 [Marinimicrobium koreense]